MKILIVEDDKVLSNSIVKVINEKYQVEQAFDGLDGFFLAERNIYDVIILDLMLPELNGYDVLKKLRSKNIFTPVLILTAKDGIDDRIKGLESGADDYLTKPFEIRELMARLEAIIRRTQGNYKENVINFKDLELNLDNRTVSINNQEIILLGKQFDLLEYLTRYKNTIITKDQIFDKIWGFDSDTATNVVEVYASGIRKALKPFGYDKYIKTVRSVGYILSE